MKSRRKRILYLSNSYPVTVSGVATVVRNLLNSMLQYFDVAVICPAPTSRYSQKIIQSIPHYFLPSYPTLIRRDVRFITPNPLLLQRVFDDFNPDLIHLHDPSPASLVLRDLAVRSQVPVIFSHHFTPQMVLGYLPDGIKSTAQNHAGLSRAILQLSCKIYDKAARLIVPTQTVKNELTSFTDLPISVISSGIDYSSFQNGDEKTIKAVARRYHLPAHPFAFYLGRLDPEKNLEVLLQAWSLLKKKNLGLRLVIAGDGGVRAKLKSLSQELGISRQIIWTGLVAYQDLPALYQNPFARVFVIPSPIESQSIVTLMAMAAGLPVVAAKAGALPELVINHKTGFLCPTTNASAFANKIMSLLTNPETAQKMGQNGSKMAKRHDFPGVINQYKALYEKAIR